MSQISLVSAVYFVGLLYVATVLVQKLGTAYATELRKVPGPWYAPFTNLGLKWSVITGNRIHYIHALHHKYGPVVRVSPTEVAVAGTEDVRAIHRIGSGFLKSYWYQSFSGPSTPPGIFSMVDPKAHATRRKLFAAAFSKNSLVGSWSPLVREKVQVAVSKIKRDAEAGTADVFKWWTFLATDVVTHLAFGESFHALETEQKSEYIKTLEITMMFSGIRSELPWLVAILQQIPLKVVQDFVGVEKRLQTYGDTAIENSKSRNSGTGTIFAKMNDAGEEGTLSERDIKQEAGNIIVAGSDTTAVTLTYLTWAVLKRPELHSQVQQEVDGLHEDFSDSDVERLPLLNAVIEETLRLYGAAPGALPRIVPEGGRKMGGYFLPGGTTVSTQAFTNHRDPENFAQPESFEPERWLQTSETGMKPLFMPFGGGSRNCIGVHLARMELMMASATFFRECRGAKLAPTQKDEGMDMENFFLIAPKAHKCEITLR